MPGRARFPLFAAAAALCLAFAVSCAREAKPVLARTEVDARSAPTPAGKPFATARPSSSPLWFEFGPEGPVSISSPQDSALTPFEPWPLARRCAGFVASGGSVSLSVNRDGFLSLVARKDGELSVYRVADAALFPKYSVASVFSYRGSPTVVIYRDRFFVDPADPAPQPLAFSAVKGKTEPVPVELPVLSGFPASDSWDIESLVFPADGRLYIKAAHSGALSYAKADSFDGPSADISAAAYRAALVPRSSRDAAGPLRIVLDAAAAELAPKKALVATVVAEGKTAAESYVASKAGSADAAEVLESAGENIDKAWAFGDAGRAVLLLGDGAYLAAFQGKADLVRGRLPALPENFTYTGLAVVDRTLVASWEEQDGWSVGSAGFLIVDAGI